MGTGDPLDRDVPLVLGAWLNLPGLPGIDDLRPVKDFLLESSSPREFWYNSLLGLVINMLNLFSSASKRLFNPCIAWSNGIVEFCTAVSSCRLSCNFCCKSCTLSSRFWIPLAASFLSTCNVLIKERFWSSSAPALASVLASLAFSSSIIALHWIVSSSACTRRWISASVLLLRSWHYT